MTTKHKIMKAAYLVDIAVNVTKKYDYARAKATSVNYWLHKAGKFALLDNRLI